jgi:hypothetical protein
MRKITDCGMRGLPFIWGVGEAMIQGTEKYFFLIEVGFGELLELQDLQNNSFSHWGLSKGDSWRCSKAQRQEQHYFKNDSTKSKALFSRLISRTFQLVFSVRIVFSLTKNQPEQYFNLFFSISERGLSQLNRNKLGWHRLETATAKKKVAGSRHYWLFCKWTIELDA